MTDNKKARGDIEIIIVLALSFSALVLYLFEIKSVYLRIAIIALTLLTFYVFYDTIKKIDIHDETNEIEFTSGSI